MLVCNPFSDIAEPYLLLEGVLDDVYGSDGDDCDDNYRRYDGCHLPDPPRDAYEAEEQLFYDRLEYGMGF
jgi:hypothetical protein